VANATGPSEITLGWADNSSDETRFEIERKTGAGGQFANIHSTVAEVESYVDGSLTGPQTYYYRVRACGTAGCSSYTSEASATITGPPILAIETPSLAAGTVGQAYSASLQASGGTTPYGWSITGGTCAWASISGDSVVGTPTAVGSCSVDIRVTDAVAATADRTYDVTISDRRMRLRSVRAIGPVVEVTGGYAGMAHSTDCTASVLSGETVISSVSSDSGPATRRILVTGGQASTAYTARMICADDESETLPITTGAALTGTTQFPVTLPPAPYTHAALDYCLNNCTIEGNWVLGSVTACASGCALVLPTMDRGTLPYIRWQRIVGGANRITSTPQQVVIY
jgi:hypothetical protein